jgi:hypothetical protein
MGVCCYKDFDGSAELDPGYAACALHDLAQCEGETMEAIKGSGPMKATNDVLKQ